MFLRCLPNPESKIKSKKKKMKKEKERKKVKSSLPFCVWHRHYLWQHPLIWNLIWKLYFDSDVFKMSPITNKWQLFFLVRIIFQRKLDELIRLHVLLLLLYRELLRVLFDVKQMVDLFLSEKLIVQTSKKFDSPIPFNTITQVNVGCINIKMMKIMH